MRKAETRWLRCGRMFLRVIARCVGFVVMDGSVVLMVVVLHALLMLKLVLKLMDDRCHTSGRRQAALHGKAIQGQAKQHEDVEDPAQGSSR